MSIMSRIWVTPLLCFLSLISFFLSFFLFLSLLHNYFYISLSFQQSQSVQPNQSVHPGHVHSKVNSVIYSVRQNWLSSTDWFNWLNCLSVKLICSVCQFSQVCLSISQHSKTCQPTTSQSFRQPDSGFIGLP